MGTYKRRLDRTKSFGAGWQNQPLCLLPTVQFFKCPSIFIGPIEGGDSNCAFSIADDDLLKN